MSRVLVLTLQLCISEERQALGHWSILFIWRYHSTSFSFFSPLPLQTHAVLSVAAVTLSRSTAYIYFTPQHNYFYSGFPHPLPSLVRYSPCLGLHTIAISVPVSCKLSVQRDCKLKRTLFFQSQKRKKKKSELPVSTYYPNHTTTSYLFLPIPTKIPSFAGNSTQSTA